MLKLTTDKHEASRGLSATAVYCWSTAGARPTIPTILGMVIEVRPIFAPPLLFFDPILSFTARGD